MAKTPPSPNISILIFILYTICYFLVLFYVKAAKDYPATLFFIYLTILIIIQFGINAQALTSICGNTPYSAVIKVTLLPWFLIFYFLNFLLSIFPGWLLPFSNTFGYGLAYLGGIDNIIDEIIIPEDEIKNNKELSNVLGKIYDDRSLLINEVTPHTYDNFLDQLKEGGLLRKPFVKDQCNKLYNFIVLKELVAKAIWYILTGILTISITYNMIINSPCNRSVDEMQKRHKKYEEAIEAEADISSDKEPRTYYSDE